MATTVWQTLTKDPELWCFVEVPSHVTDKQFIDHMKVIKDHVEELDCCKCENLTQEAFMQLSRDGVVLPKLRKLHVPTSPFPNLVYECLAGCLPALEELANIQPNVNNTCEPLKCQAYFKKSPMKVLHDLPVSSYGRIRKSLPDPADKQRRARWEADLAKAAISCNHIETYVCTRGSGYMDDKGLERLSVLFPGLRNLELQHCSVTDDGFAKLFVYNRSGNISQLKLDKPGELTDKAIRTIADNCPSLTCFILSRCSKVTSAGIKYLVSKCPRLVNLSLNNLSHPLGSQKTLPPRQEFDNGCLAAIGESCHELEEIRLYHTSSMDAEGIQKLQSGCQKLHSLTLYDCSQIDDHCMEILAQFPVLRSLVLVDCTRLTPKAIVNFIIKTPDLKVFTLYCCSKAFYADVAPLAEEVYNTLSGEMRGFRLNALQNLSVRGIGGGFLRLLTVLCSQITSLDLREASLVTSEDLIEVLGTCERLKTLDLSAVAITLTEEFLHAVCQHALELCHLELGSGARKLTHEAIGDVIKIAPSLASISLDVTGTSIDEQYLVRMAERFHGGKCHLNTETQDTSGGQERMPQKIIELQFTPLKYLGTISPIW